MNPATIPLAAWPMFVDPLAIALVFGGTLVATATRGPLADTVAAVAALRRLVRPSFDGDRTRAEVATAERVADMRGLLLVDADAIADRPTREIVIAIIDGADAAAVGVALSREAAARRERHILVQAWWIAAAETAPAMGMIGTLVGLVRMFSRMDDPAAIGGAMAIALLATLYGAVLANLIAAPIAARLGRLSDREAEARARLAAPLAEFARRVAPTRVARRRGAA